MMARENSGYSRSPADVGLLRPITLGPGLLVYLDEEKKRRMLDNWVSLVSPPAN